MRRLLLLLLLLGGWGGDVRLPAAVVFEPQEIRHEGSYPWLLVTVDGEQRAVEGPVEIWLEPGSRLGIDYMDGEDHVYGWQTRISERRVQDLMDRGSIGWLRFSLELR